MGSSRELNALFYPQIVCLDESALKHLVLLYDRVYYLPNDTDLNPGHESISKRFSVHDGFLFGAFGTRRDAHYGLMYASEADVWDDDLKRLMDTYDWLEEQGICVAIQDKSFASPYDWHPLQGAVDSDVNDAQFRYWCDRYRNPKVFLPREPRANVKGGGLMMRPPRYQGDTFFSALCAERVNSCLYFAGALDLVPVSTHELFIRLFGIKLKRSLANPDYRALDRVREQKRKARLSALSWQLLTEVVPPEQLTQRSVSDILKYKAASGDAASRFREYLFQLEAGLSNEPWDESLRAEVEKVVRTEVVPELERVRREKADIWQKLFSESIKSALSQAHLKSLAPILTMHLLPAVSYLDLICYSTAILTGGVLPKLLDARLAEAKVRQNALFFVLKLTAQ